MARHRRLVGATAIIVAAIGVTWLVPPLRARAKALAVLAESIGLPFPRPFAAEVSVRRVELAPGVHGDLYESRMDAPPILFVPGATRAGTEDPRVKGAARALARAGRTVFVPELELYDRVFKWVDVERIAQATVALGASSDRRVGVLGFSYGGSLALIAAEDVEDHLAFVALFGAYYDLANVIQGVTTGATTIDGRVVSFNTVAEGRKILTRAAIELAPDAYRAELRAAIGTDDPGGLPPRVRSVYELLENRDPRRAPALIDALPKDFRAMLERFSPAHQVDGLDAPLFIMQSEKDAATPPTEARLMHDAFDASRLVMLTGFSHVDPPGFPGVVADGWRAWSFTSWVLAAQE